jgi:8-oxo-dGTP pyrophosphatase MutT (NUDIX family)
MVLLAKFVNDRGVFTNYQFPGGGIDPHETPEDACVRECLEEVGVRIHRIRPLNIRSYWRNIENYFYTAEFHSHDTEVLGSEGDSMDYVWTPFDRGIELVRSGPKLHFTSFMEEALVATRELISSLRSHDKQVV